jgi:RNA polymerase primary sigma factor
MEQRTLPATRAQHNTNDSQLSIQADPTILNLNDTSRFYRYEIGQVELLSTEEVKKLAERIERARAFTAKKQRGFQRIQRSPKELEASHDADEARRQLVEANLRLVLHIARKYKGFGVDLMDLVQEGNIGLMHAVEKFDYRKGYRFSTYATWWIRQYVTRALIEQAHMIRVPLYKVEEIKRLGRVRRHMQQVNGHENEPTLEELAQQMDVSVHQVISLLSTNQETVSLDMPRKGGEDEVSLSDMIEDDPVYSPERIAIGDSLKEHIHDLLDSLNNRERQVLKLRYGLDGCAEHSLSETGRKMDLSHEAVRQVEFRALRKLLQPSQCRQLQDFLG